MKMIYNPIHFVKLVQKILVRNYEPIMGIWKKLFLIDLHNLQMLFMLRIKYKFSECLAPAQICSPPMEHFLAMVVSKPVATGGNRGK